MTKRKEFPTQTPSVPVRPVVGFEGLYSVSADGRVWSEPRVVPHRTSGQLQVGGKWVMRAVDRRGYVFVLMYRNAQQFTKRVHQLVAQAWISSPPEGKECINHKNGMKTDNRIENLEWVSYAENNAHAWRTGLKKSRRMFNPNEVEVILKRVYSGESQREVAKSLRACESVISDIVNNKYARSKFSLTPPEDGPIE